MNLLTAPVLGGAALVASPALWASLVDGTLPVDVAITRYLVAVVVCWLALSAVGLLVALPGPPAATPAVPLAPAPPEDPAPGA